MRSGRVAAVSVILGLCTALLALADGFHGAMNAEELSDQWNQNKYAAFSRGGDFNTNLGGNVQNLLNHMKFLNTINVQPSEFPNFKDKDIPGVKSQAMAILKEMGKGAAPVILNNLVQELNKQAVDNMGMTSNEDYIFNLKMLLEDHRTRRDQRPARGDRAVERRDEERAPAHPRPHPEEGEGPSRRT
jgi:hypothetical protein